MKCLRLRPSSGSLVGSEISRNRFLFIALYAVFTCSATFGQTEIEQDQQHETATEKDLARKKTMERVRRLENNAAGEYNVDFFGAMFDFTEEKRAGLVTDDIEALKSDQEFQKLLINKLKVKKERLVAYTLLNELYPDDRIEILPDHLTGAEDFDGFYDITLVEEGGKKARVSLNLNTMSAILREHWEFRFEANRERQRIEAAKKKKENENKNN